MIVEHSSEASIHVLHGGDATWDALQSVKNDVWGDEAQAVELYPSQSRVVDNAFQRHLWRVPDGVMTPDLLETGFVNLRTDDPVGSNPVIVVYRNAFGTHATTAVFRSGEYLPTMQMAPIRRSRVVGWFDMPLVQAVPSD